MLNIHKEWYEIIKITSKAINLTRIDIFCKEKKGKLLRAIKKKMSKGTLRYKVLYFGRGEIWSSVIICTVCGA